MTYRLHRVLGTLMGLAALTSAPLVAQQGQQDNTGYGGTAGEFLLLGAGARGAALGGAFAALTQDVTALYYNPAGLAQMSRPSAMVSTYSYVANTRYSWVGIGLPMSGGARAFGVSVGTFGFSDQPVYTLEDPDGTGETYSVAESFIGATYSQNFSDRFSAGFTAKMISDHLGSTSATGFALDFGTNFHAMVGERPIRAAFVIDNLGSNLRHDGAALESGVTRAPPLGTVDIPQELQPARLRTSSWGLPVQFRVGVALDVLSQGANRVSVLGEFTQPVNTKPGGGAGLEWAMTNVGNSGFSLAARGSYTLQPDNKLDPGTGAGFTTSISTSSLSSDGVALGGGLSYGRGSWHVGFDYAYRNLGALGGTNFLSFSVSW
ncbi:MAG TPA: PorV/PorQ family protein [Gemmatimonadales bacterium]|nr:PorV/PorQ family protein [Gemmatimonadales bacterium]